LIIADGIIRGENEDRTAPDICLDMMTDFVVRHEEVEPQSYIAIADGSKRHNMAKIYTGYYKYTDDCEMPMEERQKVPMIVIVKCGTPAEAKDKKPGNRGKRDFQIILMSFLQKVMFDERMTKGPTRNWVPVLANPDIVEHYSENVVDTLHKKTCCSWARTVI
jgi:chitin synthase